MKFRTTFAMVLLLAFQPGGIWPFHHSKSKNDPVQPPPVAATNGLPTPGPSYLIGPEDTLHLAVWKEPDLSATVPVRADGKISVPLLNDVQAAGMTPMQLAALITEKLKKYIDDPRVTVVVAQMNSQRFFVTGEVQHTGAMPLLPGMTVLQALATSGLTQFANTKKIYVLRTVGGVQQKLPVNYKQLVKGRDMTQNVVLKPGDTVVVP
jgi:polysaccharide biosynthesis/export protein